MHDYAIVGAGPAGIALSMQLAESGKTVVLLDEHPELGGCHRVKRLGSVRSEHGPKVYLGCYLEFFELLRKLSGRPRDELFSRIGVPGYLLEKINRDLNAGEKLWLGIAVLRGLFFGHRRGKQTVDAFASANGFSARARDALDAVCRIVDGGAALDTPFDSLVQQADVGGLAGMYAPRHPLDESVWSPGAEALRKAGVHTALGDRVTRIGQCFVETESGESFPFCRAVLAVPPAAAAKIEGAAEELGISPRFASDTKYRRYISATVTFDRLLPEGCVPSPFSHPWGEIMLDAGRTEGEAKSTVLMCVTRPEARDDTGVTVNSIGCRGELAEAMRQVCEGLVGHKATGVALSPTAERRENGEWHESDASWLLTPAGFLPRKESDWLFTCGHHTGRSGLSFNVAESAVLDALETFRMLEPDAPAAKRRPRRSMRLSDYFRIVVLLVALVALAAAFALANK
nr:NAD(P)/FAD-dependent oxidoreductase [Oceanusvirus sp.]